MHTGVPQPWPSPAILPHWALLPQLLVAGVWPAPSDFRTYPRPYHQEQKVPESGWKPALRPGSPSYHPTLLCPGSTQPRLLWLPAASSTEPGLLVSGRWEGKENLPAGGLNDSRWLEGLPLPSQRLRHPRLGPDFLSPLPYFWWFSLIYTGLEFDALWTIYSL